MGANIRLGRITGVDVEANWSLLVILGLITWSLGAGVFPTVAPDAPAAAGWVVAAVTAVGFFACLLAHELAHSLVARAAGMRVDGIVLWMFGGMSRLAEDSPDARTERRIALAGPLTSAGLGAGLTALAVLAGAARAPDVVVAATAWLGLMNGLLAVFNLLPAYPLDGGRVLRALVWRHTGDRFRATVVAATIGVSCGYGLLFVGVLAALSGAGLSGVWLALIGWIVLDAARGERAGVELRRLLGETRVDDVMTRDPVTVPPDITVDRLVRQYVGQYRCSAFPVVAPGGSPLGLVTLRRLRDVPGDLRPTTRVGQVATPLPRVVTAEPSEPLVELLARFSPGPERCALVLDRGALVGIVTSSDVERALELAAVGGPHALTGPDAADRAGRGPAVPCGIGG
jgi:Zn-dependent protease/predicted transcriptional regulator